MLFGMLIVLNSFWWSKIQATLSLSVLTAPIVYFIVADGILWSEVVIALIIAGEVLGVLAVVGFYIEMIILGLGKDL